MTQAENGKQHRWTKETAPRPGGKPGRVSTRVKVLKEKVDLKLEDMLGQAHTNVQKALKKGDIRTSMWLVDLIRKERNSTLEESVLAPLIGALETVEDVAQISKMALMLAIKGDMSFEQLRFVQEALARHSVLSGVIELRNLRNEVDEVMRAVEAKPAAMTREHLPSWGKLARDVTPTHPHPPAEYIAE